MGIASIADGYCPDEALDRTVFHRTVQTPLANWLKLSRDCRQGASGPAHVEPTSPLRLMRARVPPVSERQGATLGEDGPALGRRLKTNSNSASPGRCWGACRR